jgi:NAD(P)-dependent dehydrogenase (short-subunit alcohol dehydrogenase family)
MTIRPIHGSTVVITGATSGIGRETAREFARAGARVVVAGRREERLRELVGAIEGQGGEALAVRTDVSDQVQMERLIEKAVERFGRIDTLVNNAGVFIAKPFVDYTIEDFRTKISTNLAGFFHITQRAAAEMLKQGSGHIVSVTTSLTDQATSAVPTALANLTKGGINSATKALAIEYANKGVRVNAVSPGIIKTPMHAPETHDFLAGLHPMKKLGEVKDITDAVLFLESAPFITGEILHVDGGQSAGH